MTNPLLTAAAAFLLYCAWRKRRGKPMLPLSGRATIDAGIPSTGDIEHDWWDAFHGKDVAVLDYSNGIAPEPGSVGKAQIANAVAIRWNGDIHGL